MDPNSLNTSKNYCCLYRSFVRHTVVMLVTAFKMFVFFLVVFNSFVVKTWYHFLKKKVISFTCGLCTNISVHFSCYVVFLDRISPRVIFLNILFKFLPLSHTSFEAISWRSGEVVYSDSVDTWWCFLDHCFPGRKFSHYLVMGFWWADSQVSCYYGGLPFVRIVETSLKVLLHGLKSAGPNT